jgi:hypothetical protein
MNTNITDLDSDLDLFEFLKNALGCTYISDLRIKPYNTMAKFLLSKINLKKYSKKQVEDAFNYINKIY